MQKYEFVQRIPSHYVSDSCIQIMIPHLNESITILNSDGMTYHYKPNSELFINNYVLDNRKDKFPYSKIPTHKRRIGFKKIEYINQLFDFNRVYLQISDGMLIEHYVIKDGDEALLAKKFIIPSKETKIMNRTQIDELMNTANLGLYSFDGTKWEGFRLISDEKVLEWYKEKLINQRKEEQEFRSYSNPTHKALTEIIYKSIENMTPDDVELQPILLDNTILVSSDNNEIKNIKAIEIKFKGSNKYIVDIYDFPITIYSMEHLKQLEQTNFMETKEPKISLFRNPQIDKEELKKSKARVLKKEHHKN